MRADITISGQDKNSLTSSMCSRALQKPPPHNIHTAKGSHPVGIEISVLCVYVCERSGKPAQLASNGERPHGMENFYSAFGGWPPNHIKCLDPAQRPYGQGVQRRRRCVCVHACMHA